MHARLKLNKSETVVFITEGVNTMIYQDNTLGVDFTFKGFKTLGDWFSSSLDEIYHIKNNTIKTIHRTWLSRSLTLKITVLKSSIVPHVLQLASIAPVSQKLVSDLENLVYKKNFNFTS